MAGMESSPVPVEPAKTHAARVGRGGVGNYLEAKKWENSSIPAATGTKTGTTKTAAEVPVKLDTLDTKPPPLHSTGRGGTGNFKHAPSETSTELSRRTSTAATDAADWAASFGRGGAGNISAAKGLLRKKEEEERGRHEAGVVEQARAHAKAAVEAIQVPKPARSL